MWKYTSACLTANCVQTRYASVSETNVVLFETRFIPVRLVLDASGWGTSSFRDHKHRTAAFASTWNGLHWKTDGKGFVQLYRTEWMKNGGWWITPALSGPAAKEKPALEKLHRKKRVFKFKATSVQWHWHCPAITRTTQTNASENERRIRWMKHWRTNTTTCSAFKIQPGQVLTYRGNNLRITEYSLHCTIKLSWNITSHMNERLCEWVCEKVKTFIIPQRWLLTSGKDRVSLMSIPAQISPFIVYYVTLILLLKQVFYKSQSNISSLVRYEHSFVFSTACSSRKRHMMEPLDRSGLNHARPFAEQ